MKENKIKNIIIFFLALIFFIFIVNTKSCEARALSKISDLFSGGYDQEHIEDTLELTKEGNGTNSLEKNPNMYCFQRALSCVKSTYKVRAYIVLDGCWATRYYHNGDRAKGAAGYSVYSSSNMALGYIFGNNEYAKGFTNSQGIRTASQVALWGYGDTWMSNVGNQLFSETWTVEDLSDPYEERLGRATFETPTKAKQYANAGDIPTPAVSFGGSSIKEYNNTQNGEILGPFKVNFNSPRIHITSISVKDNYGNEISNGISFYLNKNGTNSVSANNITQNQEFYIKNTTNRIVDSITVNVETDIIYRVEMWFLHCYEESSQELLAVNPSSYRKYASTTLKIKSTGSLYIHKADEETGATLEGAGFKIYKKNSGWLKGTSAPYEFVNDINQATEYTMDNNNKTAHVQYGNIAGLPAQYQGKKGLKIDGLRSGTYHVYETKAPSGLYELKLQNGYDSNNKYVDTGIEIKVGKYQTDGTTWDHFRKITNVLKISIVGRVWEEGIPDKGSFEDYDSKYSEVDDPLPEIIVRLKNKKTGNPVITNSKGDDFVLTDANGMYKFDSLIKKTELENYYVEFDYSSKNAEDTHYIRYIPVAFNQDKANGSKALAIIPTQDREVKGIATTYTGEDRNQIATYGLEKTGTYNAQTLTLGNINLGIKPLITPQYDVRENLADLKINIKGYTYTYNYGGRSKIDDKFEVPIVKWQSSGYTRPVYPSDIIYSGKENAKEALEAIVTYRIDVTNNATYNIPELYQQDDTLILTSMVNEFDTNRYTLIEDDTWKLENNKAVIRSLSIINGKDGGIKLSDAKAKTNTVYIKFKVNKNAINDILNHPNGIMEDYPTKVITNGYHTYFRNDYMWKNLEDNNNVKLDNNTHNTRNVEKNSDAPYLVFVPGTDRTVSGTVFKDEIITDNGEKLGDGIYDKDKEKGVAGVKVELLDIEGKTLSHVYQYNKTDKTTKVLDAVTTTDGDGKYSLVGVVPGRYYLKFTYGNGSYKITDLDGNVIKEGNFVTQIGENSISAKDYKSTIINGDIREKFEDRLSEKEENKTQDELNEKYYTWYKDDDFKAKDYSLAVDDLNIRKDINGQEDSINGQSMSPQFSITIENTKANSANEDALENAITKEDVEKTSGNKVNLPILNDGDKNVKNNFGGFHFGIIEQPKQSLEIEKLITNLRLTNAQNNVIFNGNPETAQIVGVTDLDGKSNEGSSYVRVELAEDSIYGSDIEITYQVKITNTSDLNYYNEDYYLYGQADTNKEVLLKPTEVTDYLDKTLTYVEDKTEELNGNKDRVEDTKLKENITIGVKEIKDAQKFNLKDWETLHTSKNKSPSGNTSDKVMIVAERILSNQDDDMEVLSGAKIFSAENTPSDSTPESTEEIKIIRPATIEQAESGATLTITPPTGGNKNDIVIYAISGIISLIILATGISIIKKKVL